MDENKARTSLWLLPTDSCSPRRLTSAGDKDGSPAWSPQGDRIAFVAKREQGGKKDSEPQLYVIAAAGGEAERKSDFAPGVGEFKWMPDGRRIVFVSWVWEGAKGVAAQAKKQKAFTDRKESAIVIGTPPAEIPARDAFSKRQGSPAANDLRIRRATTMRKMPESTRAATTST